MKPIGGCRIDELAWIVSTSDHRGADDLRQLPGSKHIAGGVALQIDAFRLVDSIDVEDHALPARINIVMKADHTNPAVVGHRCRHAIELSAKKRSAGGKKNCIAEQTVE